MRSNIAVVAEGPTDVSVVRAVLRALGKDAVVTMIQPEYSVAWPPSLGAHGGGWKGVRSWCKAARPANGIAAGVVLLNADALVVHVDADISRDPEINCARPCPRASDTVDAVRLAVRGWLHASLAAGSILCVPSDATETWVVVGLFPDQPEVRVEPECRRDPASLLVGRRPKLVRKKGSAYRKNAEAYAAIVEALAAAWPEVRRRCEEAERFSTELAAALP